ncbi:MAG: flavodoxin family protein [Candidatus Lokiarchaeota archaeon]|nr:flavodoxin family protein [Candidatus Lokiarchaeota archaeon]MBD3199812.1 flavodoxin family protein [Candidatus Lokiarchaeota archaeon]
MKVVLFNGSARKEGNTNYSLQLVRDELQKEGLECEIIWIGKDSLQGCTACGACIKNKDGKCVLPDDGMNSYIEKMIEADGIILGSPTYFADVTTNMKALIERAGYVCRVSGDLLKRKVGAAVVAVRRGGGTHVFESINYFYLIAQMIVVGSSYWNLGYGQAPEDVKDDDEGIQTFKTLGQNVAYVLKKLNS